MEYYTAAGNIYPLIGTATALTAYWPVSMIQASATCSYCRADYDRNLARCRNCGAPKELALVR